MRIDDWRLLYTPRLRMKFRLKCLAFICFLHLYACLPRNNDLGIRAGGDPRRCRRQTLKCLNSRPALIAICTLVVIECICVLAELMVDLQGIKLRFENEENEISRFLTHLRREYPESFKSFEGRTLEDILFKLENVIRLKNYDDYDCVPCVCNAIVNNSNSARESTSGDTTTFDSSKSDVTPKTDLTIQKDLTTTKMEITNTVIHSEQTTVISSSRETTSSSKQSVNRRCLNRTALGDHGDFNASKLFVLEINNVKESFFLVAELYPTHVNKNSTKHNHYHTEYHKIHQASQGIHLGSLGILSVMVIETLMKLACMGPSFFNKKFEVFDAFIVIASFSLDFIFLDSRWYETGKDATTILVLLLPWRVVRIVNSFLMTVNHKHHIEMMTVRIAKKKADMKIVKLQTLLAEIRKDVQLLVTLCRQHEIQETDIAACVYEPVLHNWFIKGRDGKGRHGVTVAAMSSFASLMMISALGKDPYYEDEIYGHLFQEAFKEDDDDDDDDDIDEETESEVKEETSIDDPDPENATSKKKDSKKKKSKKIRWKRSYTVPQRSNSLEQFGEDKIFYINDGYLNLAANPPDTAERRRSSVQSKGALKNKNSNSANRNCVTFEVTTQVTYL